MKANPLPRPKAIVAWTVIYLLATVLIFLVVWVFYYPMAHIGTDFNMYYKGAERALMNNGSIYTESYTGPEIPMYYTNSPFSTVTFIPMTWLGYMEAARWFKIVNFAIGGIVAAYIVRYLYLKKSFIELFKDQSVGGLALIFFGLITVSGPWRDSQALGQINIVILGLVLLDFALSRSKNFKWPEGILVGIAAGIKILPLALGLYYVGTRNWRGLLGMLTGFIFTVLAGFIMLPKDSQLYWTKYLVDPSRAADLKLVSNNAIAAPLNRFFGSGELTKYLWMILVLAIVFFGLMAIIGATRNSDLLGALAISSLVMMLIPPMSLEHVWVWLAIILPMIFYGIWNLKPRELALKYWGYFLLIVGTIFSMMTNYGFYSFVSSTGFKNDAEKWNVVYNFASVLPIWGVAVIVWWLFRYRYPMKDNFTWLLRPGKRSNLRTRN